MTEEQQRLIDGLAASISKLQQRVLSRKLQQMFQYAESQIGEEPEYPHFRLGDCVVWNCHEGVVEEPATVLVRWNDGGGVTRLNVLELKRRQCNEADSRNASGKVRTTCT